MNHFITLRLMKHIFVDSGWRDLHRLYWISDMGHFKMLIDLFWGEITLNKTKTFGKYLWFGKRYSIRSIKYGAIFNAYIQVGHHLSILFIYIYINI